MRKLIISVLLILLLFLLGCQLEKQEVNPVSLKEMQYCKSDNECVYADNSCCPATKGENIVAINSKYYDYYKSIGKECGEDTYCIEIYTWPSIESACIENKCTSGEALTDFIQEECQSYCRNNDKESWDNNYLTTKSVGVGSACDILKDMEIFYPYRWIEENGEWVCYEALEDDTSPPESD